MNSGPCRPLRAMSDFCEAVRALLQAGVSKLEFDFLDNARQHSARIQTRMADPRWDQRHKEVIHAS